MRAIGHEKQLTAPATFSGPARGKTESEARSSASGGQGAPVRIREHDTYAGVYAIRRGECHGWAHMDNEYGFVACTLAGRMAPFATLLQAARWILGERRKP